jgi:hypothetical protein
MNIDPKTGNIELEKGKLIIRPDVNRDEFVASSLGESARPIVQNNQYATYSVTFNIGTSLFCASLVFESQKLHSVQVKKINPGTTWSNWSEAEELEHKSEHDRLLFSLLGTPPYKFVWGEIVSMYDPRSGSANINIQYRKSR